MRQRIDLGAGLVALGAIGLLISLFLDWFSGASAWQSFEIVDWLLAACAVAALVAAVLSLANATAAPRWMRGVILAALALVLSQLIDPPGFSNKLEREVGIWLALAGAALMTLAVALSAASVSVTVDVRGRERRRRVSAVDRRGEPAPAPAAAAPPPPPPAAARDPERTQPLRPIDPQEPPE